MASVVAFNTAVRSFQRAASDSGKKLSKAEATKALEQLVNPGASPGKTHLAAVQKLLDGAELTPGAKEVLEGFLKKNSPRGAWTARTTGGADSGAARRSTGGSASGMSSRTPGGAGSGVARRSTGGRSSGVAGRDSGSSRRSPGGSSSGLSRSTGGRGSSSASVRPSYSGGFGNFGGGGRGS